MDLSETVANGKQMSALEKPVKHKVIKHVI
jgi:hypothetical protein